VSFAAITICVASRVFIVVAYFVMTQSGNFWIRPSTSSFLDPNVILNTLLLEWFSG